MPRQSSPRRSRTPAGPQAVGLVETLGYAAAVQALDAAVKAAQVSVVGYDLTRGNGWVCVKIQGEVAAVQAAVDAAREWAARVSQVVAAHVIARPDGETGPLIGSQAGGAVGPRPAGGTD